MIYGRAIEHERDDAFPTEPVRWPVERLDPLVAFGNRYDAVRSDSRPSRVPSRRVESIAATEAARAVVQDESATEKEIAAALADGGLDDDTVEYGWRRLAQVIPPTWWLVDATFDGAAWEVHGARPAWREYPVEWTEVDAVDADGAMWRPVASPMRLSGPVSTRVLCSAMYELSVRSIGEPPQPLEFCHGREVVPVGRCSYYGDLVAHLAATRWHHLPPRPPPSGPVRLDRSRPQRFRSSRRPTWAWARKVEAATRTIVDPSAPARDVVRALELKGLTREVREAGWRRVAYGPDFSVQTVTTTPLGWQMSSRDAFWAADEDLVIDSSARVYSVVADSNAPHFPRGAWWGMEVHIVNLSRRPGWDPLESTCRHASLSIL